VRLKTVKHVIETTHHNYSLPLDEEKKQKEKARISEAAGQAIDVTEGYAKFVTRMTLSSHSEESKDLEVKLLLSEVGKRQRE